MPFAHDSHLHARGSEALELRPLSRRVGVVHFPQPSDPHLEEAVCEAVFRYQLRQPLADAPQPPHYFVAQRGRDPDEALLRRLRTILPEVQPFSQCRVSAREGVVDRATGVRGRIVQVARLAWIHAAAVDVVGGYYITHQHAASFRYHLVIDERQWTVVAAYLLWRV